MRKLIILLVISVTPAYGLQKLSPTMLEHIGSLVWHNECACNYDQLAYWKKGEQWASIGIGHFIWYPAQQPARYTETFPALLDFLHHNSVILPAWLYNHKAQSCPWRTWQEFHDARTTAQMQELRKLMYTTRTLQTEFMVHTFNKQLDILYAQTPEKKRLMMQKKIARLASTPQGVYALIDYSNCKGFGTNHNERYKGQGWGLLQVLERMSTTQQDSQEALKEFVHHAQDILRERVANAPCERNEQQWLKGWINRVARYTTY
jgi:hypothetical protein